MRSLNNPTYAIPSHLIHTGSTYSTATTNSQSTICNTSFQSSKRSDRPTTMGSSTTFYASSRQSDSLYNAPTNRSTGKILTTSFDETPPYHNDSPRLKFYRDLPSSPIYDTGKRSNNQRKLASSTTNIKHRKYFYT